MRDVQLEVLEEEQINLEIEGTVFNVGGNGGTSDYNALKNKPQINGVTLQGNKSHDAFGVSAMSVQDIEKILYLDT